MLSLSYRNGKNLFHTVFFKKKKQNQLGCKLALTSATEVVKVAPFQNSMNFRARIPQSNL